MEKFKEMVNRRSSSKHISALSIEGDSKLDDSFAINTCSIKVSDTFNYLPDNAVRQKKNCFEEISENIDAIKRKINISDDSKT